MLLNSNYGIISCFSLPAARYFRGPKVPKGPRFLGRKLPKNQKVSAAVLHPSVSLSRRYSEFSMGRSSSLTPPYGAPSLLKLPASFCLRRPFKVSGWRGSIGVWIKVFNFFVGFLLVTFLFQKKSNRKRRINHPSLPLSSSPSYTPRSGERPAGRWPALPHPWR